MRGTDGNRHVVGAAAGRRPRAPEVARRLTPAWTSLQRLHRAVGLARIIDPALAVHPQADAESVLHAVELAKIGFEPEEIVLILRLLMDGLTHAAIVMCQTALQHLLHPGSTELELAQAAEAMARQTDPVLGPMVEDLLRLALRHSFQTDAVNATERAAGALPNARDVAVAFADLVGFTRLGEAVGPEPLARLASGLGDRAREVAQDPVQFVKTIGDAVMFVSAERRALLHTVLDLVDAVAADALPRLRVGVAYGLAASYAADWYGRAVNVASRITAVAPPRAVYAEESARRTIGDVLGIAWQEIGARRLKGVRDEA
ncbi:MAG TPA: adenylate cyclase regulatory domain-containing protein, partial [Mycobacterium sp.]